MLYLDLLDGGLFAVMQRVTPNGTPYLIPATARPREVDPTAAHAKKLLVQVKFPSVSEQTRERILNVKTGTKEWKLRMRRDEPAVEFAMGAVFPPNITLELQHMGEFFDKSHAEENDIIVDENGQQILDTFQFYITQNQSSPLTVLLDPIWVEESPEHVVQDSEMVKETAPVLVGAGSEEETEEEQEFQSFQQVNTSSMDRETLRASSNFEPFAVDDTTTLKGATCPESESESESETAGRRRPRPHKTDSTSEPEPESDPNEVEFDEDAGPDKDEFEEMENTNKEEPDPEIEKRSIIKKGPHAVMAHVRGDGDATKSTTIHQSSYASILQEVPSETEPVPESEDDDAATTEEDEDDSGEEGEAASSPNRPSTRQSSPAGGTLRQSGQKPVSGQQGSSSTAPQSGVID